MREPVCMRWLWDVGRTDRGRTGARGVWIVALGFLFLAGSGAELVAQGTPVSHPTGLVVKNRRVEFTFGRALGLYLRAVQSNDAPADGFQFSEGPLWEVTLHDPTQACGSGQTVWSPATTTYAFSYTLQELSDRQVLTMDWTGVFVDSSNDFDVQVVFELESGSRVGSFSATVSTRTPDFALYELVLPRLGMQTPPATENTWLVTGWAGGVALKNPGTALLASGKGWNTNVPSLNPAELFTLYRGADPAASLYFSTADPLGYAKKFSFSAVPAGDQTVFHLGNYPEDNILPGLTTYVLPYSPEIGCLDGEGGWWSAAWHYRGWAREAGVLPKKLRQRTDLSLHVKNADLFARVGVDAPVDDGQGDYREVNNRITYWLQYFNDCSSPLTPDCVPGVVNFDKVIAMVAGWHGCQPGKITNWFMFDPPADPTVQDMLDQAPTGVHFIPYFNPRRLSDNDLANQWLLAYASLDECGNLDRSPDLDGNPQTMNTTLDVSSQDVNDFLEGQFINVLQPNGWSGVYLDNWANKDGRLEFSGLDGHPVGGGNFMTTSLVQAIQDFRAAGRVADPDYVIAIEHLQQSSLGDIEFTYENWPVAAAYNCAGGGLDWFIVPIQAVVYNGYVYRTRSQMALDDIQPFEEDVMKYLWTLHLCQYGLEPAFTNGDSDDLMVLPPPNQRNEELYRFLQKMLRFYHFKEEFFKFGKRMKDPLLTGIRTVPHCSLWPVEHRYLHTGYGDDVYPTVYTAAWKASGVLAISMVNWHNSAEDFTLQFDAIQDYRMKGAPAYDLYEERETGRQFIATFNTPVISYSDSIIKEEMRVFTLEAQ